MDSVSVDELWIYDTFVSMKNGKLNFCEKKKLNLIM